MHRGGYEFGGVANAEYLINTPLFRPIREKFAVGVIISCKKLRNLQSLPLFGAFLAPFEPYAYGTFLCLVVLFLNTLYGGSGQMTY